MAKKVAAGSTAKATDVGTLHGIKVGESLTQNVEGHPPRKDSKGFVDARATLHKILAEIGDNFFGHGDGDNAVQAHHGGSIWVRAEDDKWLMVLNVVGVEWNEQFAAAPEKIDYLRQIAKRVVDAFPKTRAALKAIGYDPDPILDTPVTDASTIETYVDSLFNACVPLPQKVHTGSVTAADPNACGIHNFPVPAWGMSFIHRPDFQPFVPIGKSGAVAHVAPVSHKGSGDKRVRVLHVSHPNHPLAKMHAAAEAGGQALSLEAHDPIAQAAFGNSTW